MAEDRTRSVDNLAPDTRRASEDLLRVCRAAKELASFAAPAGRGPGRDMIEDEVGALRERVANLTSGADALDLGLRSPYRLLVVGPSQAGKSTLINVIAGHRVLPTAGAGDAKTLKETVLTYSSKGERTLRVQYISRGKANERRFALESHARRQPGASNAFVKPWKDKERAKAKEGDDAFDVARDEDRESAKAARRDLDRRYETLVMQIKTLIYPEIRDATEREGLPEADSRCLEDATVAEWADGWRLLLGQETVAGGRFAELWKPRLAVAAQRLGKLADTRESAVGKQAFRAAVEEHTAEGMAFLVERVELALPAADLEQMDVEDLPGVGNFGDPAADVARDVLATAMRERDLDGLLVVTAQNGLDRNTANLLAEASVLRRVLQGQTDLAIAITHVDQIARGWVQDLEDRGVDEDDLPEYNEILRKAGERASGPQREKLVELLRQETEGVEEPEKSARVAAVLERTRIVGVEASAAEAYRFGLGSKKRGAFATDYEGTGVSELIAHFKDRAEARHKGRLERVLDTTERISESVDADLRRLILDHDADEALQLAEAAREAYLEALKDSKLPLSNRWATIRERAATKLSDGIPGRLPLIQIRAQREASKKKRAVIRGCRSAGPTRGMIHWATMRAALRWGGTWSGAHHLDLPGELAGALMPALLAGWRQLASDIKGLLDGYQKGAEALLTDLDAAAQDAARSAGLEPNRAAIADARKQLGNNLRVSLAALNAQMDQLNERVQQRLREVLKDHFEKECRRVIRKNPLGGPPGLTRRLLEGYDEIGEDAIEKGAEDGTQVLKGSLDELTKRIRQSLFDKDPVSFAYQRLVAGIHDAVEPPEITEARRALVAWARDNLGWLGREAG